MLGQVEGVVRRARRVMTHSEDALLDLGTNWPDTRSSDWDKRYGNEHNVSMWYYGKKERGKVPINM